MTRRYVIWTIFAVLVGISAAYSLSEGGRAVYFYFADNNSSLTYLSNVIFSTFTGPKIERPKPPTQGKAILIDLSAMRLELYQDGERTDSLTLVATGKRGTPWETVAGNYFVSAKNLRHYSAVGKIWLPYSIQFSPNLFIHGIPTGGGSGGSLRLKNEDAKAVYDFTEVGTPVFVFGLALSDDQMIRHYEQNTQASPPKVNNKSYLVADLDSGEILEAKNQKMVLPIASISKLMTALISLENLDQTKVVTISKRAANIGGSGSGSLRAGEKIEIGNLIYPLLLVSSNSAAEALAENYGRTEFIGLMNEKAKEIGLSDTSFEDPSGLSSHNVSTAEDLYKLARYIYQKQPYIFNVSSELGRTTVNHSWFNSNDLAAAAYFLGGKNGFTDEAKQTMLSLWSIPFSKEENRRLALITLGSASRKADAEELLRHIKKTVAYEPQILPTPALLANATGTQAYGGLKVKTPLEMIFVGDIMLDRGVEKSVIKQVGGDFAWLAQKLETLKSADILFGNLEGPLSDQGKDIGNLYSFRMDPAALQFLTAAGFDVVDVANNHAGDWGLAAFRDTLARLAQVQIAVVGGGSDFADASRVKVINKNGYRIGFLAASDVGPASLAVGEKKAGILLANDSRWPAIVRSAANQVDILVVSYHYGNEYQKEPTERQKSLAKLAIDNGARIVVGHHPHVVQTVEKYKDGIIAFSLGNFIFDQYFSEDTMSGLALKVKFFGDEITEARGVGVVLSPEYQPSLQVHGEE